MTEQISKSTFQILKLLPHPVLKFLKLNYRHYRFKKALNHGRKAARQIGYRYPNRILFIAGLPKSGTTWFENMLSAFPGYTIIPDPEITKWDYKHGGTHRFELSMKYFDDIKDALALVKIHCHGSRNNVNILQRLGIRYCIMYRDLRNAAISYTFYVKRTPWHPEFPVYKGKDIKSSLLHFANTLLPEWLDWVVGWQNNRDKSSSIVIKYEGLLDDTATVFKNVVSLYGLPTDNIDRIVQKHEFSMMKKRGSFFRKGGSDDWKNYFDEEIKTVFKNRVGDFLIHEGYEQNFHW
jgi:hypothetical protein